VNATLPVPAPRTLGLARNDRLWIVLVDYNGLADTRKCLQSLANVTDAASVVVIDNASKVDVTTALQEEFPWVDFVRSPVNGGWAGGNNLGVQHAMSRGAEWIILLNNDTIVPPRFVARLMEAADSHPEFGVLGPVILFMDEPTKVQTTGVVFNRPDRVGFFQPIPVPHHAETPIGVVECDIVNGCCLMIRRDVVEKIGLVDERFFLIHEESDWCLRAQKVTKLGVVTDGLVWHKGSSTFKREGSKLQRYFDARNLIRLLWKHRRRPTARRVGSGYQHLFGYLYHRYSHEREAGQVASAEAVLEGIYDGLTGTCGPMQARWRPGLGMLKWCVSQVWRLRSR
jgi:GT2 family glycosyltransferase